MIVSFQHGLSYAQSYLHGLPFTISLLVLLVLGLALCFAGRILIKGIAFIIVGVILAMIGATIGAALIGPPGLVIGAAIGFIVGGFLGMLVVKLGVAIALGYLGYSVSTSFVSSEIISIVAGIALFVVGVVIANQLLSITTAAVGGLLLFEVLSNFGFGFLLTASLAIAIATVGAVVQLMRESHTRTRTIKTTETVQTN